MTLIFNDSSYTQLQSYSFSDHFPTAAGRSCRPDSAAAADPTADSDAAATAAAVHDLDLARRTAQVRPGRTERREAGREGCKEGRISDEMTPPSNGSNVLGSTTRMHRRSTALWSVAGGRKEISSGLAGPLGPYLRIWGRSSSRVWRSASTARIWCSASLAVRVWCTRSSCSHRASWNSRHRRSCPSWHRRPPSGMQGSLAGEANRVGRRASAICHLESVALRGRVCEGQRQSKPKRERTYQSEDAAVLLVHEDESAGDNLDRL